MVRLNYSPMAGSSVPLSITFRDNFGNYYVPQKINYTFVALNSDEQSWKIVDNINKKEVTPATSISILLKNVQTYTNTTPIRKVLIEWVALVDNMETKFIEEIYFEIQPQPTISGLTDENTNELEQYITFNINKLNTDVVGIKADILEFKQFVNDHIPTGEDDSQYVTESYINTKLQTKADKSYVDTKIASIDTTADNPIAAQYDSKGYISITVIQKDYVTEEEKEENEEENQNNSYFTVARMEAHDMPSYTSNEESCLRYILKHLDKLQILSDKFEIKFHAGEEYTNFSYSSPTGDTAICDTKRSEAPLYLNSTAGSSGELGGDITITVDLRETSCGSGSYKMRNIGNSLTMGFGNRKYMKRDITPLSPMYYYDGHEDGYGGFYIGLVKGLYVMIGHSF